MASCTECGNYFHAEYQWAKLCKPCYVASKKNELQEWMNRAFMAEAALRRQWQSTAQAPASAPASAAMDPHFIRQLLQLCHPDKHAGSVLANEVTQSLLKMRKTQ
jgi:hypothetical protein